MLTIDKKEESADKRGTCCSQEIKECRQAVNVNAIMNTKTNPQHTSNSYNGDTMGRDSPSALLDMLAEVASQTLHSEKKRINSLLATQCKSKTANIKRKESCFTVSQLLSMPVSHLVKQFAIFTSDELKRQYSYTCALVPECQQKYTSFASEGKARTSIKNHLEDHLEYFKVNKEAYDTFTAKSINHKNLKTNLQNKKNRVQQVKKPQETLNKENKDVISEKSTNYLRKILLNDINIKDIEKQKCFSKSENKEAHNSNLKNTEPTDFKVLGDHSYSERLDDKIPNRRGMSSLNNVLDNTAGEENIVLMVVGTDSVHMKEYSHINQKLSENTNCHDSNSSYLTDLSWSDESRIKNTETSATTKPKGKAKFIGTSKEEREMALAYMDRIKKKGNPTGSNLQCRICDPPRTFTAPTTLVSHYRSHAGIKPYECRICRAVFTRRHSLKYHMLIHQNQTRFTCADCGKKFRHPSHFREHQRRHTGEAPFGCDDCGQRFKTRNTYKRHLKTRHGKILTTTGELLHLPEEDFQKVRTNRKRKDCVSDITTNADIITSNAIVDFEDQHGEPQQIVEEYVLKDNIDDINRNWETRNTIQVVDKCFESFEICSESHLNKTDGLETEIAIDSDKDDSDMKVEYINGIQDNLLQLKNHFCDNLEVSNNEEVVYQHNLEDQNKIYDCNNVIQSYTEINCSSSNALKKKENITECEGNIDFREEQDESNLHMSQESTAGYHNIIYDSDTQENSIKYMHLETEQPETRTSSENNQIKNMKYNTHAIIAQNDIMSVESSKYAHSFDRENKECVGNNITYCTQTTSADVSILQTFSKIKEEIPQDQNNILQQKYVSEPKSVESVENPNVSSKNCVDESQQIDKQQNKQYLYVRTEPLNDIITQNKCINIPLHQINLCREQQNQSKTKIMDNCRKIKILNGDIQAINIKQSGKQNAILFVSSDSLKNGILQIDRNSVELKEITVKRLKG